MSIAGDAAIPDAEIMDRNATPVGPIHPGAILDEEFLDPSRGLSHRTHE